MRKLSSSDVRLMAVSCLFRLSRYPVVDKVETPEEEGFNRNPQPSKWRQKEMAMKRSNYEAGKPLQKNLFQREGFNYLSSYQNRQERKGFATFFVLLFFKEIRVCYKRRRRAKGKMREQKSKFVKAKAVTVVIVRHRN